MSRARKTKNPKRRRRERRKRILQEYCALVDQQAAQADGAEQDSAEPPTTALPSGKDAPVPENASTEGQKTPSPETKRQCKHRKLPVGFPFPSLHACSSPNPLSQDRLYYPRPGKMERQYLGFQRRVTSVVYEKIAKGSATLDKWKRDAGAFMDKFRRQEEEERESLERHLRRIQEFQNLRLQSHQRQLDRMAQGLVMVRKRCDKLSNAGENTG
ncbi:hypothetical protein B0J15DRAFT_563980 [Fusarium solani]|uniref:Uncharacterized protein n=1 Tax=Fusarium solani TaxID=169388 RepID=A0A9P9GYE2_FUSSL|nr:uncharacterized protein B0J15DRAFT_563980 [Fusarium solani]KAH7247013.1 hypothetical protein B0J15DRAFT_563980 [Fusarium solani]